MIQSSRFPILDCRFPIFLLLVVLLSRPGSVRAEPIKELPKISELLEDAPKVFPRETAPSTQPLQPIQSIPPMDPLESGKGLHVEPASLIVNSDQTPYLPELLDTTTLPPKEPPMRKALQKAGYSTLLATLMLATSASAETPPPTLSDIAKQVEAISKQLESISKRLDSIETGITPPDGSAFAFKKLQDDMLQLKKQITALEQKTPHVAKRVDTSKSTDPSVRPITSNMAKVKFVNDWIEDVSVIVNGVSYEVMIGTELTVPVPPGSFTYQILNFQRREMTRTIDPDKVWTVQINTRNQ